MNELQISAVITAPGSSVNGVTIATFPAGYRPASTHNFVVATSALTGTGNGNMTITSGGVMQSANIGAGASVGIEVKIPLDL